MTVICFRDGIMAADGRVTQDNTIFTNKSQKIFRLKSGGLMGVAGDANDQELIDLVNKVKGNIPRIKQLLSLEFEFQALVVKPDKSVYILESFKDPSNNKFSCACYEIKEPFVAVGSGSAWAMGAMDRKATAKQAVLTAIHFDNNCGGQVTTLKLEE